MRMNQSYEHEERDRRAPSKKQQRAPAVLPACGPSLWPMMREYLEGRELDYDLAVKNGWYPSDTAGDGEVRIVMPATRGDGGVFWQARAVLPNIAKRYQSPSASREDALILVSPSTPIKHAAIVEGPMDALAAAAVGLLGIALMGNTPNQVVLEHVAQHLRPCTLVYAVSDANAITSAVHLVTWLRTQVKILTQLWHPYPYSDLAAMPLKIRQQRFNDV